MSSDTETAYKVVPGYNNSDIGRTITLCPVKGVKNLFYDKLFGPDSTTHYRQRADGVWERGPRSQPGLPWAPVSLELAA